MAAFAAGGLAVSCIVSALSYELTESYLIRQRQSSAVRQSRANARLVRAVLRTPQPDIPRLLGSLETPSSSRSLVYHSDKWFSTSAVIGPDDLPQRLRDMTIIERHPVSQRYHQANTPVITVGIPLTGTGAYFETHPLVEFARTMRVLQWSLLGASAFTFMASIAIGAWVARRVLRPLNDIGGAAAAIAGGELNARLDAEGDEELVRLAEGFNAMVDTLQERIERDARFASDVSHELRSPLTTLRSAAEIMHTRREHLDTRSRRALDLLGQEVDRFEQLVQDLLEISRYDAGVARVDLQPVDITALVERVVADAGLTVSVASDLEEVVLADERRLSQALHNIVNNAAQHAGGVSAISIGHDDHHVRITVEDNGPGIPTEDRYVIFERFARGRSAGMRSSGDGVGLGLALVAEHVRLQDGRVWLDPSSSSGSRFVIELPRRPL